MLFSTSHPYNYLISPSCAQSQANCYFCNWDNGAWVCDDWMRNCTSSWTAAWPGPADKNPTIYQYTKPITTSPSPTSTYTYTHNSDDNLVEKIAIPVVSVTGVSLTSFLTYYFCKKKKRKAKLMLENKLAIEDNNLEIQDIELTEKELSSPNLNPDFIQSGQKIEIEESQLANQQSVQTSEQRFSVNNYQPQLITFTPPTSPTPSQTLNIKQLMLNELRTKLIGNKQLWTDYLEVNQLLIDRPNSQFVLNSFHSLQNQLLQIFTISEIGLLIENETTNTQFRQSRSLQTEYSEFIEESIRGPQTINYRNPQWRG